MVRPNSFSHPKRTDGSPVPVSGTIPEVYGARSRRNIPWTQEELDFLNEHWYQKGDIWCACELHRTWEDCRHVALDVLGLKDPEKLLDKEYRRVKNKV